jgi:hypothetical protein
MRCRQSLPFLVFLWLTGCNVAAKIGCPGSEKLCDGNCVDLATDSANCGACDNACAEGRTCLDALCGTGSSSSGTTGGTTAASSSGTSGTTGASSTSTNGGSGTAGTTASGSISGGSTSTGSGTGTAGTNGSGTIGGNSTSASTTGAPSLGGPYVGYDAGPRPTIVIDVDAGCTYEQPVISFLRLQDVTVDGLILAGGAPQNQFCGCNNNTDCASNACGTRWTASNTPPDPYQCVQCVRDDQCPDGLGCDTSGDSLNDTCVQCSATAGCDAGQVCDLAIPNGDGWIGNNTCRSDCRSNPASCSPGYCEGDSGVCYDGWGGGNFITCTLQYGWTNYYMGASSISLAWCKSDSDCIVDGGGACYKNVTDIWPLNYTNSYNHQNYTNGFGYCVECTIDGGGCASSADVCQPVSCLTGFSNGVSGSCVNCFLDGGACGRGMYCLDAGSVVGPDGGALLAGICLIGCLTDGDCGGVQPVCVGGACVQCATNIDCPDWTPGCSAANHCDSCSPHFVGSCPGSTACDTSQCGNGKCVCYQDSDCPLDVPKCVGTNSDAGTGGNCACTDSSQCPNGYVCDSRGPYGVTSGCGAVVGGACIAACAGDTDCSMFAATYPFNQDLACNTTTGYCVACVANLDCTAGTSPTQPYVTPSCLSFPDGGDPQSSPTVYTGGGQCGCNDTSQCNGGYVCSGGKCAPPCAYDNGYDSCETSGAHCNTYTGLCQQCQSDIDCANIGVCVDGGCVACRTGDDCLWQVEFGVGGSASNTACVINLYPLNGQLVSEPNCQSACTDSSECPTDGGWACFAVHPGDTPTCNLVCVVGDDAGLGTIADGGQPCPSILPLCASASTDGSAWTLDAGVGVCSLCLGPSDGEHCDAGACGLYCGATATCNLSSCQLWNCNC